MHFQRSGFHAITPYLLLPDVAGFIAFIKTVFGANVKMKFNREDGSVMHAEVLIGDAMLMMGEPPDGFEIMTASLFVYVQNSDAVYELAIKNGGKSVMPVTTMEHAGERYGGVKDSWGNIWWISTHIEDVDEEEEKKRLGLKTG